MRRCALRSKRSGFPEVDHLGGLAYLLRVNPKVDIYAPKENFGVFGSDLPGTFYRKDPSLPIEQRYFDGEAPQILRFGSAWPKANFHLISESVQIAPGIYLIALVSQKTGTLELHELSLALDTPDGLVIVVGCSHPGIDQIVQAGTAINPRIHFIAGGLHLVTATDADIQKIVETLHDTFKVEYIAPGHCTGEPAFAALRNAFGGRYLYAGLGTTLEFGSTPFGRAHDSSERLDNPGSGSAVASRPGFLVNGAEK